MRLSVNFKIPLGFIEHLRRGGTPRRSRRPGSVQTQTVRIVAMICLTAFLAPTHAATDVPAMTAERMFEWTIESGKVYSDPFNDVDVDVIFGKDGRSWRVPTFWRGGQRWTVRFAPPTPGRYDYHLESTDKSNPDLNGHTGNITITPYTGNIALLKHGPPRVSTNRRYFEYSDGTPFFWLGDTWWAGLSSRLSWDGFQRLTADRKTKGFTVIQTVAGLVPGEEVCPKDPGCQNEGGAVWTSQFAQINPRYFDYADRRIQQLLEADIAPAIVGAWWNVLDQIGIAKIERHWRYIIARYGAYPVFWIVGGEVFDPTATATLHTPELLKPKTPGAWTEVARFLRATDPYHHPLAAHEKSTDDSPLQEEALTDFRLFQPSHFGWPSIGIEVAQLDLQFARTEVTKPLVVGEIGYEALGGTHLEDFQRTAFWLAMLNGAAGFTYGAAGTWESYTADKPFQRQKWSFLTWEEGMNLPGSSQIGAGSKLLRRYSWWKFEPHPDWVTPRGTTLFEPRNGINDFHVDLQDDWGYAGFGKLPQSEWKKHGGNFRLPYAAGIPREVRIVYLPSASGMRPPDAPTVLGLEPGVRYRAYYWEPSLGIKVDLGVVKRPNPGAPIVKNGIFNGKKVWTDHGSQRLLVQEGLSSSGSALTVVSGLNESDLVVSVDVQSGVETGIVFRYKDINNYIAAIYSGKHHSLYLIEHKDGKSGKPLGRTPVSLSGPKLRLIAEVRGSTAILSLTTAARAMTTPIVEFSGNEGRGVGLICDCADTTHIFTSFEVDQSPTLVADRDLERRLYDAAGQYRGELSGPGIQGTVAWDDYGKNKLLLLDAYRPEEVPTPGDWLLVLEASNSPSKVQ